MEKEKKGEKITKFQKKLMKHSNYSECNLRFKNNS